MMVMFMAHFFKDLFKFQTLQSRVFWIVLVAALAWATSITNEFVGYDDIKLIVRNDRIQNSVMYAITFYWNIVSDSHNVAWTNYPTVIFRPLEWVGSSIGYHIWGARGWAFHLFVNYSFHIINAVLFFFIISKVFVTPLSGNQELDLNELNKEAIAANKSKIQSKTKKSYKTEAIKTLDTLPISWWLPFVAILVWVVHPLHNEAVNMLTSGVGFLWSTLFALTAITINLYVKDLTKPTSIALVIFAWVCSFISYHGSEMTVIAPIMLTLIFARSAFKKDFHYYGYELQKVIFSISSFLTYYVHRTQIVSEQKEWMANGFGEFFERLFVLAPEILMHYLKLFVFPAKLTIDEHHNVILENAFTLYHLFCLAVAFALAYAFYYFFFNKDTKYFLHNQLIAGSIFFSIFSIAMSLNIIPLYVLARDRYTYFFTLGLILAMLLILDKYLYSPLRNTDNLARKNSIIKISKIILVVVVVIFSIRSAVKSLDWHDGEKFWTSTIDSVDDIGTKQNWRYRLVQYYQDPGTDTFVPDPKIKEKVMRDFFEFPNDFGLFDGRTINSYLQDAQKPEKYLLNKYGYIGNKTIASALFFNATEAMMQNDRQTAMRTFQAAHVYYPGHFQTNLQLFIHTFGGDPKLTQYLLDLMEKDAVKNSFLAKGLMDGLFFVKYPDTYKYAEEMRQLYPNTQVFTVYAFHGALMKKDYPTAYKLAKDILRKYHEQDIFEDFVRQYEAGYLRQQ